MDGQRLPPMPADQFADLHPPLRGLVIAQAVYAYAVYVWDKFHLSRAPSCRPSQLTSVRTSWLQEWLMLVVRQELVNFLFTGDSAGAHGSPSPVACRNVIRCDPAAGAASHSSTATLNPEPPNNGLILGVVHIQDSDISKTRSSSSERSSSSATKQAS